MVLGGGRGLDQELGFSSISGDTMSTSGKPAIRVNVQYITSVSACADLTLPPGAGLCIDTIHGPVFLVMYHFVCCSYFIFHFVTTKRYLFSLQKFTLFRFRFMRLWL